MCAYRRRCILWLDCTCNLFSTWHNLILNKKKNVIHKIKFSTSRSYNFILRSYFSDFSDFKMQNDLIIIIKPRNIVWVPTFSTIIINFSFIDLGLNTHFINYTSCFLKLYHTIWLLRLFLGLDSNVTFKVLGILHIFLSSFMHLWHCQYKCLIGFTPMDLSFSIKKTVYYSIIFFNK